MTQSQPTHEPAKTRGPTELRLSSPAFADGATIPKRYTADGEAVSPPLTWNDGPDGTVSFALILEDPDAPRGTFTHWLVWNLDATEHKLPEDIQKSAELYCIRQGENDFGGSGYGAPSPPPGPPHRYVFRLFALDVKPDVRSGATRKDLERAMQGHILAEARLVGIYGR